MESVTLAIGKDDSVVKKWREGGKLFFVVGQKTASEVKRKLDVVDPIGADAGNANALADIIRHRVSNAIFFWIAGYLRGTKYYRASNSNDRYYFPKAIWQATHRSKASAWIP